MKNELKNYAFEKENRKIMNVINYGSVIMSHNLSPIAVKIIYDDSGLPQGFMVNDSAQYAFVRNLQGDVIAMIDQNGNTVMEYSYDPWGNIEYHLNDTIEDEETAKLITALCPLTYRGYNYDFTTGLYYLQSRYYNPEWGRFLNCDDTNILLATQGETHNANLFAYCDNNPVNKVDYTGYYTKEMSLQELDLWLTVLILNIKTFEKSDTYSNYLDFDLCDMEYRIKDDIFKNNRRYAYLITNIAFYDTKEKKYYIIKTVMLNTQYLSKREEDIKEERDKLNEVASGFVEGSLEEIIDSNNKSEMIDGFKNLAGDGINYVISLALIEAFYHLPRKFVKKYNDSYRADFIVGFKVEKSNTKAGLFINIKNLTKPVFYDDVEAIDL